MTNRSISLGWDLSSTFDEAGLDHPVGGIERITISLMLIAMREKSGAAPKTIKVMEPGNARGGSPRERRGDDGATVLGAGNLWP